MKLPITRQERQARRRRKRDHSRFVIMARISSPGELLADPIADDEWAELCACWRKRYYGTEERALLAAQEHPDTPQEPYKCSYCDGWHLTSV